MAEAVKDADVLVSKLIDEAKNYIDEDYSPKRAKAMRFYKGELFGNEEQGRSQVVVHAVRTAVKKMMPSLLRMFFGSERVVEFIPRTEADTPVAEQQNDVMEVVVRYDNDGFNIFYSWFKDALVKGMGITKWWWDEEITVEEETYTVAPEDRDGVMAEAYGRDGVKDVEFAEQTRDDGLIDLTIKFTYSKQLARYDTIPPEHFVFSPNARDVLSANLVGEVCQKTMGELIAMGYTEEELEDVPTDTADGPSDNDEELERDDQNYPTDGAGADVPWANRVTQYAEVYVRVDEDGDGIPELRRYCMAGGESKWTLLHSEGACEIPYAVLIPDPEPHKLDGLGAADDVMDIQAIQSNILRGVLDSLNLTLNPATEVVLGQVNMQDLLNTEIGKLVRVRAPGMIREIEHTFVGGEALPLLQYFDGMRDERTGLPDAAAGLDPDALQSSTATAVNATVTGAQQQIEMVARVFAGTGVQRLFRGLAGLLQRHGSVNRTVRLRDSWVPFPKDLWNAELDTRVNVALGTGLTEQKLSSLAMIAQNQMNIYASDPDNGIVDKRTIAYTLRKGVEIAGFPNSSDFYKMPPEGPEPPKPPSMEVQLQMAELQMKQQEMQLKQQELQLEAQRIQGDLAIRTAELEVSRQAEQTRAQEIVLRNQADQLKTQTEYAFRIEEMKAKMTADVAEEQAKLALEKEKMLLEHQLEMQKLQAEMAMRERELQIEARIEREKIAMQAVVAEQQAEADAERKSDATE